jgi:hypothetical protein
MFFLEEHRFCVQGRGTRKRLESRFHLCGRISKFGIRLGQPLDLQLVIEVFALSIFPGSFLS